MESRISTAEQFVTSILTSAGSDLDLHPEPDNHRREKAYLHASLTQWATKVLHCTYAP